MTRRYAESTDVPVERSRAEIEGTLRRYGADQFMSGWGEGKAMIAFRVSERFVKFYLPLPREDDERFKTRTERANRTHMRKVPQTPEQQLAAWEQACRQAWRALALCIKAKLEAVAAGITTFEEEFMAHIIMPDGKTVGHHLKPSIEKAYASGKMPLLLPGGFGDE